MRREIESWWPRVRRPAWNRGKTRHGEPTGQKPSPRESEALELLAKGCSNAEIARALGISVRTVKFHFSNLFKKSATKAELVRLRRARILLSRSAPPAIKLRVLRKPREQKPPSVTQRESTVLELLAKGLRSAKIATALGISDRTVKFHLSNLFRKSNTKNRINLLLWHLGGRVIPGPNREPSVWL